MTAVTYFQISAGGSPGCRLHRAAIEELRDRLIGPGLLSDEEIERSFEAQS